MDRNTIIDGLKMTRDLCVFDPSTGEEIEPHLLNDINRTTYDACKGALEILEQLDTDSDTISRKAAIDAFIEHCYLIRYDHNSIEKGMTITGIRQVLEQLPSAQPEINCSEFPNNSDTISRQAAIDALCEMPVFVDCDNNAFIDKVCAIIRITHLPPAQPAQHIDADGTLWITVTDIEQVKRVIVDEDKSKFCRQFYMDAQPEQHYDEWCDSCKEYDKEKHSCPRWNKVIKSTVEELKSAQPEQRTGEWIDDGSELGCQCSECGKSLDEYIHATECMTLIEIPKFCPHCGAKMAEEPDYE